MAFAEIIMALSAEALSLVPAAHPAPKECPVSFAIVTACFLAAVNQNIHAAMAVSVLRSGL